MNLLFFINQFTQNRKTFSDILSGIEPALQTWKQNSDKWSLLEIVCHLYDEEREDFRQRFQYILDTPEKDPPSINPQGWVTERKYIEQNYLTKLVGFLEERDKSIAYLKSLTDVSWDNQYEHKHFGSITANHYLHNWLAHDYLHIKQITKLKYDYLIANSDQDMSYAGEWK